MAPDRSRGNPASRSTFPSPLNERVLSPARTVYLFLNHFRARSSIERLSDASCAENGAIGPQGQCDDLPSTVLTPGVAKTLAPVPSRVRALPDLGLSRSAPVTLAPPAAQSRHRPREHQPTRQNSPNDIYSPLRVVVHHSSSPAPWRHPKLAPSHCAMKNLSALRQKKKKNKKEKNEEGGE